MTLATYIQKMPHGIVDKQEAGIGATTLEINSKRHSIIVSPTKILAYTKYIKLRIRRCMSVEKSMRNGMLQMIRR